MNEYKFRTPYKCQNGHFNYLYFTLDQYGIHDYRWGDTTCKCPKGNIDEGYRCIGKPEIYTCKQDKNKTDIYEGDILSNGTGRIGKVVYFEPQACFDVVPLTDKGTSKAFEPCNWCYCEVIDNLHTYEC